MADLRTEKYVMQQRVWQRQILCDALQSVQRHAEKLLGLGAHDGHALKQVVAAAGKARLEVLAGSEVEWERIDHGKRLSAARAELLRLELETPVA